MSRKRYIEEFKIEAVKQLTEQGHPVTEVATISREAGPTTSLRLPSLVTAWHSKSE